MPSYIFKCPACKQEIVAVRSRKYVYVRDRCNGGTSGRQRTVRMKYVRAVKPNVEPK